MSLSYLSSLFNVLIAMYRIVYKIDVSISIVCWNLVGGCQRDETRMSMFLPFCVWDELCPIDRLSRVSEESLSQTN